LPPLVSDDLGPISRVIEAPGSALDPDFPNCGGVDKYGLAAALANLAFQLSVCGPDEYMRIEQYFRLGRPSNGFRYLS